MDNRLKMRISRMLRSSFASCRTQNLSDVTDSSRFLLHHDTVVSPKVPTFPSICRPKHSSERRVVSILNDSSDLPRKKVSDWPSPFRCPPASPITPLKEFGYCEKNINSENKKKKKTKKKKNKRKPSDIFPFRSCRQDDDFGGYWWYSSDDDDEDHDYETDTLFSSKSLSSDSSRRCRRRHRRRKQREMAAGIMPLQQGTKVKDTFAVVKRSSDPYNDFRTSMVEMIVEKRIFAPRDLENLLQCFLSLNSCNHHKIIVEVFMEIWEALFSDWF